MVLPFITALISAGAAIMSAVSSIGTAVSTFVATVGPTLASLLAKAGPMIEKMAHFANSFLEIANILQQGEDVRHLGDRALQAANAPEPKKPENYSTSADYLAALREFKLNPEISNKTNEETKLVAGLAVSELAIKEKFNINEGDIVGLWLLPLANDKYFTPEKVLDFIGTGSLVGDVYNYLEDKLSAGDEYEFISQLGSVMGKEERVELYKELDASREAWNELKQTIEK